MHTKSSPHPLPRFRVQEACHQSLNISIPMDQQLLALLLQARSHLPGSIPQQEALTQLAQLTGRTHEDSLERQLLELTLEARSHPSESVSRQQRLTRLIILIEQSGRLTRLRKYAQSYPASMFTDLYNEAKQKAWMYICNNPELYRPEKPVLAWVNSNFKYKFLDILNEQKLRRTCCYDPFVLEKLDSKVDLEDFETTDYYNLRLFLETDPEQKLAAYWVRNHPDITFQFLAISRHIKGETWIDLSTQNDISFRTLSSFFQRTLRKLLPYFKRYL